MTNARSILPWLLLLCVGSLAAAEDVSSDRRFLAGLRERGLFQLAETYCTDQLEKRVQGSGFRVQDSMSGRLPPTAYRLPPADLVIELSRCLADWAANSPPAEREPLWRRAWQVTEDFARTRPKNPRLLLVRLQGALGLLTRGELARQEAQLVAHPQRLLVEARTQLQAAAGRLGRLEEEVKGRLGQLGAGGRAAAGQFTEHQLVSLLKNIQYQRARALCNQGQCYAADSADRADSLLEAVKLLEPLARLEAIDPLAFKSRIDLVVCNRLLTRRDTAGRMLDAVLGQKPPPSVELRARAEQIQLALAAGRLDEAVAVLSRGRRIDSSRSAELDYAWLETYLRAAAGTKEGAKTVRWEALAIGMFNRIEQLYGPYWTRRAGMLLVDYVRASPQCGNPAILVCAAESSYRSDRLDDAAAMYDRAKTFAARGGDADRAFELGYAAAAIEHHRGRHQQALARYRDLATAMPKHGGAAEAHLLAIYHAGRLVKGQPAGTLDDYAALLQEHLQTWPKAPSANRVRRQLGRLREHQRKWPEAIDAYRTVLPEDPDRLQAVEAAGRCYKAWLGECKAAGKPTGQIAAGAADWFESLLATAAGQLPGELGRLERFAALQAASLRLNYTPAGYARAEQVLSAALGRAAAAPAEWKSAARALLVLSLAGQGQHAEARGLLERISAGPTEGLLDMLEGLGRVAETARPQLRTELARLQLRTIELLDRRRDQLGAAGQRNLERIRSQATAATKEAYARSLLAADDRGKLEEALSKWRELERKSRPGSPRWFRAKYSVAWLHYKLGNKQRTVKMIALLKLLHPELGGPEMKRQFDQLLAYCQR